MQPCYYLLALTRYRTLLPCFVLLVFFHAHFIPDDGDEDQNVKAILLMLLCENQCSLHCRQVGCKLFKFLINFGVQKSTSEGHLVETSYFQNLIDIGVGSWKRDH